MNRGDQVAFPNALAMKTAGGPAGLSVREWGAFTIAAGMCAHPDSVPESDDTPMAVARTNVAINAVKTVDAVLAALAEPTPSVVVAPTLPAQPRSPTLADDVRALVVKWLQQAQQHGPTTEKAMCLKSCAGELDELIPF